MQGFFNKWNKKSLEKDYWFPLPFSNVQQCLLIESTAIVKHTQIKRLVDCNFNDIALGVNGIFNLQIDRCVLFHANFSF